MSTQHQKCRSAVLLRPAVLLGSSMAIVTALTACLPGRPNRRAPTAAKTTSPVPSSSADDTTASTARTAAIPPVMEPAMVPLSATEPLIELDLTDAIAAVVSLPLGSTEPRPVLVAAHGAGGRARMHCQLWREIIGDRGFVVCPRGSAMYPRDPPHESGYFYDGHPALGQEIAKALQALADRFGDRVDLARPIFAGYSQGANMGALILPTHPASFGHAVLWEGGVGEFQEWNIRAAKRFHERGGRRVILACGRADCVKAARLTATNMRRGGLEPRIVFVAGAGHTYAGPLRKRVLETFAWLVEDDDRW